MQDLLKEYRQSLKGLNKMINTHIANEGAEEELKVLRNMSSSMNYCIDWMRKGHNPDHKRGVERRDAYKRDINRRAKDQREYIFDPGVYQWTADKQEEEYVENEKAINVVGELIWDLSKQEKEVYMLHKSTGFTIQEIAEFLKIEYESVKDAYKRASDKVLKKINENEDFFEENYK
jgi:RNA polymerase sigma-70 factor (ECF subfamily)